ncbi:UNVERIFIED_CONTAM: putative ribonuclease H protein [Sesamum radiatum]|uniref:Ribonuclease H protein n=1 Tax=Sesamum radiatum TaxID=300843 RepID=A0AAW2U8H7_SESRA
MEVANSLGFMFHKPPPPPRPKLVWWTTPTNGWMKLNCDGTSKGNPGPSGAAGVIRDSSGGFCVAFHEFLGEQANIFAELYAVVRGVELAMDYGINNC